ncbi:MAG: SDR family NAD(P)-dependent oxidoreductase [Hyphomonadaceae bacterium]
MAENAPVCAVVGAGPGNGAALARRFAANGYRVALLARDRAKLDALSQGIAGSATFVCDATDSVSLTAALTKIAQTMGPIDTLVYNAGKGVWGDALSVAEGDFEGAWRLNAFGLFAAARAVLPAMLEVGKGNILVMGATASRRGGAQAAAFAAAKGAQRLLAESLARAYGPRGVHVALLIVDAVVGEPLMRVKLPDRPDDFFCMPDDIASAAHALATQPRSAWTFECDLRPFGEKW